MKSFIQMIVIKCQ